MALLQPLPPLLDLPIQGPRGFCAGSDTTLYKKVNIMDYFQKNMVWGFEKHINTNKHKTTTNQRKYIDDKMDVGMDFGRLLDRFLVDFGTILGGKLAASWHINQKKEGTKTRAKNLW